jgi:hypothetical protein
VLPHLENHCRGLRAYQKNQFVTLSEAQQALVREQWAASFVEFGYRM